MYVVSMYVCMYVCMYGYIHTYIHTYLPTYVHTCMHAYKDVLETISHERYKCKCVVLFIYWR